MEVTRRSFFGAGLRVAAAVALPVVRLLEPVLPTRVTEAVRRGARPRHVVKLTARQVRSRGRWAG